MTVYNSKNAKKCVAKSTSSVHAFSIKIPITHLLKVKSQNHHFYMPAIASSSHQYLLLFSSHYRCPGPSTAPSPFPPTLTLTQYPYSLSKPHRHSGMADVI